MSDKEGKNYNCDYKGNQCWLYWLRMAQYWV